MAKSLAQIAVLNDTRLADIESIDILEESPILRWLAARISSNGITHRWRAKTGAPSVGYRTIGTGKTFSNGTREEKNTTLKLLSANSLLDTAEADLDVFGKDHAIDMDVNDHLIAALADTERQILNGTDNNADGYTGFKQALNELKTTNADKLVTSAGGTTADEQTSVYLVRSTDDHENVSVVGKGSGTNPMNQKIEIGMDPTVQTFVTTDADTGAGYPAHFTKIEGWLGVAVGGKYSVARMANVEPSAAGKGVTDAKLSKLWAMIPTSKRGKKSDWRLIMNTEAQQSWQESRTATNDTGKPAPLPDVWEGIEVIPTDNVKNDEAVVA